MKNRHKTKPVTIEIYDADGVLCESVGGPMDFEDIKAQLIDIIKNDGIPVVRSLFKKETAPVTTKTAPKPTFFEQPMTVRIEFEDFMRSGKGPTSDSDCRQSPSEAQHAVEGGGMGRVKFMAVGKYDDVIDAQDEFLAAIMKEE